MTEVKHSDIIRTLPGADNKTGLYVDSSVEAGDGIMYDVDPSLWGQYFWATIHLTAFGYPDAPSDETKQAVFNQFDSYRFSLLCGACREHYRDNLQQYPIEDYLDSRDSLIQWTILIHSKVNESLGKPAFDFSAYLNKLMGEEVVVFADEDAELIEDNSTPEEKQQSTQEDTQADKQTNKHANNQTITDDDGDITVADNKEKTSRFLSARPVSESNAGSKQHARPIRPNPAASDKVVRQSHNARKSLPVPQKEKHAQFQQQNFDSSNNTASHRGAVHTSSRLAVSHAHRIQQQMSRNNVAQQQQQQNRSTTSRSRTRSPPPPGSRLAALVNARNRAKTDSSNKSLSPSSFSRPSATSIRNSSSRQQADSLHNARFKRPTKECENCTKSVMKPSSF